MWVFIYGNIKSVAQIKSGKSHQTFDGSCKNIDPLSNPVWMDSARAIRADIQYLERSGFDLSVQTELPLCYAQARRPISKKLLTTRRIVWSFAFTS
jgi:hypothetical protein